MRKVLHAVLAAAVLFSATTFYAPTAQASPDFDQWTIYYDSQLNENGWHNRNCSGYPSSGGTLSCVFMEKYYVNCDEPSSFYSEYFHYCSGVWVQVAYLGDTSC